MTVRLIDRCEPGRSKKAAWSVFRRKPAAEVIRGVQRFAAEHAISKRNLEHVPIPS
jgi:hypothetical protein